MTNVQLLKKWWYGLPASLLYKEQRVIRTQLSSEQIDARIQSLTTSGWADFLRPRSDKPFRGVVEDGIFVLHFRGRFTGDDQEVEVRGRVCTTENGHELTLDLSYGNSTLVWLLGFPFTLAMSVLMFLTGQWIPIAFGIFFPVFCIWGYFSWFKRLAKDTDRISEILIRVLESDTAQPTMNPVS